MTSDAATFRVNNRADMGELVIKVARLVEIDSYSIGFSEAAFYATEHAVYNQYG